MVQVILQTEQEKYDMYMKLPKEELVKLLLENIKLVDKHYFAVNELSFPIKDIS